MSKKIIILLIAVSALITLSACQNNTSYSTEKISFYNGENKLVTVKAEVADTLYKSAAGLMYREKLDEKSGMLFTTPQEQIHSLWMKNMKIPLDMIFVSQDLKVVSYLREIPPCAKNPCSTYLSEGPAMYSIEVNAGFVDKYKITKDSTVKIY